jgi:hypothetical protein
MFKRQQPKVKTRGDKKKFFSCERISINHPDAREMFLQFIWEIAVDAES